jgi:hypothetical protein
VAGARKTGKDENKSYLKVVMSFWGKKVSDKRTIMPNEI